MASATPEEIASWPAPNFDHPENRGPILLGLTAPFMALVVVFTAMRFYGKGVLRQALGIDDWVMLAAGIFSLPVSVMAIASLNFGLGLHIWDQKPEWHVPYNKMGFVVDILFPISCSLTKISLCLTYLRLFPSREDRIFCYVLGAFVTLYTAACIFLMLFQCTPIRGYWDTQAGQHCINMRATLISIAALNSLSDFLVYLWPAKPLWSLQLPLKQRLGLILLFSVGCLVCVAGIIRMYYLEVYFKSYDLLWNACVVYAAITTEMNIGIICGCLSGVKPVMAVVFPRLFGSSYKSNTRPATYGRTGRATHPESFPFQPLFDSSSKARDKQYEHAISIAEMNPEDKERRNFAWASSSGDDHPDMPYNTIVVKTVVVREEEIGSPKRGGKDDGGSEEWIIEDFPEPGRR